MQRITENRRGRSSRETEIRGVLAYGTKKELIWQPYSLGDHRIKSAFGKRQIDFKKKLTRSKIRIKNKFIATDRNDRTIESHTEKAHVHTGLKLDENWINKWIQTFDKTDNNKKKEWSDCKPKYARTRQPIEEKCNGRTERIRCIILDKRTCKMSITIHRLVEFIQFPWS